MKKKKEKGDDEDEDIIKKRRRAGGKGVFYWVVVGGVAERYFQAGKGSRPCPSLPWHGRCRSPILFIYLFILTTILRKHPQHAPSSCLTLALAHTCPYTYKYNTLDHPF